MKKTNKSKNNRIKYYKTYNDDFVESRNQSYKLPQNYKWINNNLFYKIWSNILYFLAYIFGLLYCRIILHIKIKNKKILKIYKKQGYFLYGNHTQAIGDVFTPAIVCSPKRIYTIADKSNIGVAGIGPLLPILGILPIPDAKKDIVKLLKAIEERITQKKCVVIYPEAHVWPYYTKIRPFESTSFKFPVNFNVPSFCITTTYYKRKLGKKPGIIVYVDGPFIPDEKLNKKEKQENLCNQIYKCMLNRSKKSTYEYIEYRGEKKD